MGCGSSVAGRTSTDPLIREALERTERDLAEHGRKMEEKNRQIAQVQRHVQTTEEAAFARSSSSLSSAELRTELDEHRQECARELQRQRTDLTAKHHQALQSTRELRFEVHSRAIGEKAAVAKDCLTQHEEDTQLAHEVLVKRLQADGDAAAKRHRHETEHAERETERLRERLISLKNEREEAAHTLSETREMLRNDASRDLQPSDHFPSIENKLAEVQEERLRSAQRYADLETHLRSQMQQLHVDFGNRSEEVRQKNALLVKRNEELTEVNNQLAELQRLFCDVCKQLQSECDRLEQLQGTVSLCTTQNEELEHLQSMLTDAHGMVAEVRQALEEEKADRVRAAGLLEHEKQRTQLLLDVLRHFKDKLRGLTPQALLNRLRPGVDAKAILASLDATPLAGNDSTHRAVPSEGSRLGSIGAQVPTNSAAWLKLGRGLTNLPPLPAEPIQVQTPSLLTALSYSNRSGLTKPAGVSEDPSLSLYRSACSPYGRVCQSPQYALNQPSPGLTPPSFAVPHLTSITSDVFATLPPSAVTTGTSNFTDGRF